MMHEGEQASGGAGFAPQKLVQQVNMVHQRAQHLLDSTAPYTLQRWGVTGALLFLFLLRIVLAEGWYIGGWILSDAVCYALFIYLLNLFLAFLTPKFDPAYESDLAAQDVQEGEPGLPTSAPAQSGLMSSVFHPSQQADEDEFRPFIRRLPEFKVGRCRRRTVLTGQFWLSATQAVVLSLFASFFEAFNIPVFWPVLVLYFMVLFVITMRRQIQ